MRKIKSYFFISLDGVVESPDQWHFPYFDDEMGEIVGGGFAGVDAMLMGRVLYDEWAAYWPEHASEPFGEVMNGMKKYVVSNSLEEADWRNSEIVSGDVAKKVNEIKAEDGDDITMSGSGTPRRSAPAGTPDRRRRWHGPSVPGRRAPDSPEAGELPHFGEWRSQSHVPLRRRLNCLRVKPGLPTDVSPPSRELAPGPVDDVGDHGRAPGRYLFERHRRHPIEETFTAADDRGRDMQSELIDQPGCEILIDGVGAPRDRHVIVPASARARSRAEWMPSVTNRKMVPPSIGRSARFRWPSTNTGP